MFMSVSWVKTFAAPLLLAFLAAGSVSASDDKAPALRAVLTESSDGVPIAVTISGNPDGKELLFIHDICRRSKLCNPN